MQGRDKAVFSLILCATLFSAGSAHALMDDIRDDVDEKHGFNLNMPNIDAATLSVAPVNCGTGQKILLGNRPCNDTADGPGFINHVSKGVKNTYRRAGIALMHGYRRDWKGKSTAIGANACNLLDGEEAQNKEGQSCGKFCDIQVSTTLVPPDIKISVSDKGGTVCKRENGYFFGIEAQVLNKNKQDVLNEFKAKNVKLVDFDGVRPCALLARDAMRLQAGVNNAIEEWAEKYGQKQIEEMTCKLPAKSSKKKDENPLEPSVENSDYIAECNMLMGQESVPTLWLDLLGCEIEMRTKKFFIVNMADPGKWFDAAKSAVADKCQGEVCVACSDAKRTKEARACYEREAPKFIKQKMKEMRIETPGDSLLNTSSIGGLQGLGFAFGMLARARRKRAASKRVIALLSFLLLFAFFVSGCGCDSKPNLSCPACDIDQASGGAEGKLSGQLTQGCAWNKCMAMRWSCGEDTSSFWGGRAGTMIQSFAIPVVGIATLPIGIFGDDSATWRQICTPKIYYGDALVKAKVSPPEGKTLSSEVDPSEVVEDGAPMADGQKKLRRSEYLEILKKTIQRNGITPGGETKTAVSGTFLDIGVGTTELSNAQTTQKSASFWCAREMGGVSLGNASDDYMPQEEHATDPLNAAGVNADSKNLLVEGAKAASAASCPAAPPAPGMTGPLDSGGTAFDSGGRAVGSAMDLAGTKGNDAKADPKKTSLKGGSESRSATAADRPGLTKKAEKGAGPETTTAANSPTGPKMVPFGTASGGGSGSGMNLGSTSSDNGKGGDPAASDTSSSMKTSEENFATAGQSGAAARNGGAGTGLFGGGGEAGPVGAGAVNYGTPLDAMAGGAGSLEDYLAKVGNMSLFEVVNKRMDKWGHQLHTEDQAAEFKKLGK